MPGAEVAIFPTRLTVRSTLGGNSMGDRFQIERAAGKKIALEVKWLAPAVIACVNLFIMYAITDWPEYGYKHTIFNTWWFHGPVFIVTFVVTKFTLGEWLYRRRMKSAAVETMCPRCAVPFALEVTKTVVLGKRQVQRRTGGTSGNRTLELYDETTLKDELRCTECDHQCQSAPYTRERRV
jgi:hypothetical protein